MKKRILFSPIGNTDPISYNTDGSMLHICRNYKPDIVYLYLSKEMLDNHKRDNRYKYCLDMLSKEIGHEFVCRIIERENLSEVQLFDEFYEDFESCIKNILKIEPGAEILLNVSSGTPAMKSALQVIAAIGIYDVTPIQVTTPLKKSNKDNKDYDVEVEWVNNKDNCKDFNNRSEVSKTLNLFNKFQRENIIKHIEAYDYYAARTVAESIKGQLPDVAVNLLDAACCRLQLNKYGVDKVLKGTNIDIIPVKDDESREIFEYLLWLQSKVKRNEYADFLRGLTPVVLDLFDKCLLHNCQINIHRYCEKNRFGTERLLRSKLSENFELLDILDNSFSKRRNSQINSNIVNGYKDSDLGSMPISILISAKCCNKKIVKSVQKIRFAETAIRNVAAHEIVSVTEQWIKNKIQCTPEELFAELKFIASNIGIDLKEEDWNSYDDMNQKIKNYLY